MSDRTAGRSAARSFGIATALATARASVPNPYWKAAKMMGRMRGFPVDDFASVELTE